MNNSRDDILEFFNALWGRRWYAIAISWIVCVIGWGAVATMPDQYEASARVFVDTSSVLRPLLKGIAVESNVQDELNLMRQTLLSRENVEKVLRITDLDLVATTINQKENLIALLQDKTRIRAVRGAKNLFEIQMIYSEAERARDIVQAFMTVFVESNIGENRGDAEIAREFLADQTQFYRTELEKSEKNLADFRAEFDNLLPESTANTFTNYRAAERELNESILRRNELKRQLSSISPLIEKGANFGADPILSNRVQISKLEAQLENLLSQYTESHPDVVIAKRRLKTMNERMVAALANEPTRSPVFRESNPVYEALKIELVQSETNISIMKQRFKQAQEQWEIVRQRSEMAPHLAAEKKKLERDYSVVKRKYEQLLDRQKAMFIATERSVKTDDVKFRIVDAPIVPTNPVGPNRPLFLGIVLLFGLGAGMAGAAGLVITRETFQNVWVLKSSFSIPVYGAVHDVKTGLRRRKVFLNFFTASLAEGSLVAVFLLLVLLDYRIGLPNVVSIENAPQSIEEMKRLFNDGIAIFEGQV